MAAESAPLPELADVYWRPRLTPDRLRKRERLWTLTTLAHVVPFLATAALLMAVDTRAAPLAVICAVHAWILPGLYAARGANVLLPKKRQAEEAESTAAGLLGDLVGHANRDLFARTGFVTERGRLGTWLVGTQGAALLRGGRIDCWCVRVADPDLPAGDRVAHLLLALRSDEEGFATVANLAFSGARWRVRRRTRDGARAALDEAANLPA